MLVHPGAVGPALHAQAVHAHVGAAARVFHVHALLAWAVAGPQHVLALEVAPVGLHAQHRQHLLLGAVQHQGTRLQRNAAAGL
ncbi:hypothetical protein SDC9_195088 [bioreactor metagenome]|uniref:Uncharacterized protein n=1 Tax=bioreactor metagenome TaxID=1076179 RepID=A0A645I9A0_9ZZZZ